MGLCLATGDLWSEQLYKRLCLSHGKCLWSCLNTQLYVKQLRLRAPFQGCPSNTLLHPFPLNSYSIQISTFLFHPVVLTFPFAPLPTLQLKNTSKYISYLKTSFYSSALDLHLSTTPSIFFLHSQGPWKNSLHLLSHLPFTFQHTVIQLPCLIPWKLRWQGPSSMTFSLPKTLDTFPF